jgi:hypothetical protein
MSVGVPLAILQQHRLRTKVFQEVIWILRNACKEVSVRLREVCRRSCFRLRIAAGTYFFCQVPVTRDFKLLVVIPKGRPPHRGCNTDRVHFR